MTTPRNEMDAEKRAAKYLEEEWGYAPEDAGYWNLVEVFLAGSAQREQSGDIAHLIGAVESISKLCEDHLNGATNHSLVEAMTLCEEVKDSLRDLPQREEGGGEREPMTTVKEPYPPLLHPTANEKGKDNG